MELGSDRKPRLLIILNRFVIGGQAVDTFPLAYLLQQDFEILVAYGQKEKDELEASFLLNEYPGVKLKKVHSLKRSLNPFVDLLAFLHLLIIILQFKPAIVHTHGAKPGLLGRIAAFICRVPVVVHTYHGHLFHSYFSSKVSSLLKFVERSLSKITSGAIALSPGQYHDLVQVFNIIPAHKCRIIPLGVTIPEVDNQAAGKAFRNKSGLQPGDVAIGIVGRIVAIKNLPFFVQVIKQLLCTYPHHPPAFFIVGDGGLRAEIENQLSSEGIRFSYNGISENCRVVFTSWLTNIEAVMCGLDIVALTSLNEGTPLSLIEAQMFERPVVATNVGGVKDTLLNAQTGFYVDSGDLVAFCEKMQCLINNPSLRITMGSEGKRFVQQKFSKQKEVVSTRDFYFSLLKDKI